MVNRKKRIYKSKKKSQKRRKSYKKIYTKKSQKRRKSPKKVYAKKSQKRNKNDNGFLDYIYSLFFQKPKKFRTDVYSIWKPKKSRTDVSSMRRNAIDRIRQKQQQIKN
jgi:hypothetical protein